MMDQSNNHASIVGTSRIKEWGVPKAGNLLAIIFIIVGINEISFFNTIIYFLPSLVTIAGIGAFGHIINDWTDISADAKAGKKNRMAGFSPQKRLLIALLSLSIALLPWFVLPFDNISIILLSVEFLLLLIYAIPPLRFKERGILGLLADSLYAYALPSILAAYTFYLIGDIQPDYILLSFIFLWQFFLGIHSISGHQVSDYENDLNSETQTFATKHGLNQTILLKKIFCYLEIACFLIVIAYISLYHWNYYFILPLIATIIWYLPFILTSSLSILFQSPHHRDIQNIHIPYHKFLIYWHLLFPILQNPCYLVFLPFIYVFLGHHRNAVQAFLKSTAITTANIITEYIRLIPNYSIFFWRTVVKGEDEKIALREHYEDDIFGPIKDKKYQYNLFLINRNAKKYTETFVWKHLVELPFNTNYYYGKDTYYPRFNLRGELIGNLKANKWLIKYSGKKRNLPKQYFLEKAFQAELKKRKPDVVLVEFGTTGATVIDAVYDMKIPLVCIFHGYDIHNKSIRNQYKNKYPNLFKKAAHIIGVSKEITNQLEKMGVPPEKLTYLPCGAEQEKFPYRDHSKNPPIFLSVGRFAATKSPHLTILAFADILKSIPKAQLIMVGQDEHQELWEACHILARALGIEKSIEFTGIIPHSEVSKYMEMAFGFIQHSLTTPVKKDKEGTPVAIQEAMQSGLPVISTNHAGISDIIIHKKTGLLSEEYNFKAMANNAIWLYNNPIEAKKIGKQGSLSMRDNPLLKNNIEELANILEGVIIQHQSLSGKRN